MPAGSVVRGVVTDVKKAGRVDRKGSLTLTFDQIRINGRSYPIRGTMTQALEAGGYKEDAGKIGAGAITIAKGAGARLTPGVCRCRPQAWAWAFLFLLARAAFRPSPG